MKQELEQKVILGTREYGISLVLFQHAAGELLGLNVTDMECLGLLFHRGIATPTELSRHTGLSSGATTAMLDRLEKTGLIARRPNPKDRRGVLISVVKEASAKVAPLFIPGRTAQNALMASYSTKELQLLLDFFERSVAMWDEQREALQQHKKVKKGIS